MKHIVLLAVLVVCTTLVLPRFATAQTAPAIPPSITTPDKVETRLGTLDFKDGMPSPATLTKVYDNLDAAHAFNAFVNTMQGVNMEAIRKGMLAVGIKDNEIGSVLRIDGRQVPLPDRKCRHRILRWLYKSVQRTNGVRDAAKGARRA